VIEDKNREITEATREKDRHVEELRTQKDSEIAELNARIVQLSRKRYAEDLERDVRELLAKLSDGQARTPFDALAKRWQDILMPI